MKALYASVKRAFKTIGYVTLSSSPPPELTASTAADNGAATVVTKLHPRWRAATAVAAIYRRATRAADAGAVAWRV